MTLTRAPIFGLLVSSSIFCIIRFNFSLLKLKYIFITLTVGLLFIFFAFSDSIDFDEKIENQDNLITKGKHAFIAAASIFRIVEAFDSSRETNFNLNQSQRMRMDSFTIFKAEIMEYPFGKGFQGKISRFFLDDIGIFSIGLLVGSIGLSCLFLIFL